MDDFQKNLPHQTEAFCPGRSYQLCQDRRQRSTLRTVAKLERAQEQIKLLLTAILEQRGKF